MSYSLLRKYKDIDFDQVYNIVHDTIELIYPQYYPSDAVAFFHAHHSLKNMQEDLKECRTCVIVNQEEKIIGVGSIKDGEIKRVFVTQGYQNKGHGAAIMRELESIAMSQGFSTVVLDASLGAFKFYKNLGYQWIDTCIIQAGNGFLVYHKMNKLLLQS